jgi:hypothetical protein
MTHRNPTMDPSPAVIWMIAVNMINLRLNLCPIAGRDLAE